MTRGRLTAFRVNLLSTLIVVLLYVWASHSTLLRNVEAKALDLRFHLRSMKQPGAPVILVAIVVHLPLPAEYRKHIPVPAPRSGPLP